MNGKNILLGALSACLIMTLASSGFAQSTTEELLEKINARKEKINQFKALLGDPDQSTRLAALDVMLKSDDTAMKEVAYGIGFSSADDAMRALALKGKFRDIAVIPFKLGPTENATEKEKSVLQKWTNTYDFQLKEFDEVSGQFSFQGEDHRGNGQVSGTGFEFRTHYCRGYFTLGDGASLAGQLLCKGGYQGTFNATARLQ